MGVATDHLEDSRCDCCGKVGPTEFVYIMQIDETVETCEKCRPEEDPRL